MDSSRNFQSIRVIIFINNLCSIHLIDLEKGPKSFIPRTKLAQSVVKILAANQSALSEFYIQQPL
jgi:hypothetical protein